MTKFCAADHALREGPFSRFRSSTRHGGASYLIGLDLHLTRERMHELFRALEQRQQVVALLDRFLVVSHGRVGVHVGSKPPTPRWAAGSDRVSPWTSLSGVRARIAVLGPMRMHYETRVISAVSKIGQAFRVASPERGLCLSQRPWLALLCPCGAGGSALHWSSEALSSDGSLAPPSWPRRRKK